MASSRSFKIAIGGMLAISLAIASLVVFARIGKVTEEPAFGTSFKLASSRGGFVDSEALKGKPYGIFFGFTHCPVVCPTTLFEMSTAMQEAGSVAKDFRLIYITVDPERDTAEVMKDYLSNFDPRIEGLVPSPEALPNLARAFHVYYKKEPTSDGSYTMDHTATVFLLDSNSRLQSTISFDEDHATRVKKLVNLFKG